MTLSKALQPQAGDNTPATVDLRQGDVIEIPALPIVAEEDTEWIATPNGVVVVSQTCDLVRPDPPLVAVAPLVEVAADKAKLARQGRQPSLVHVPEAGETWFVDLRHVASVSKSWLAIRPRRHGVSADEERSRFGKLVGRKFARFAFPDEVVYWLRPLEDVVTSKHRKPESAEGRMFQYVEELRVKVESSWRHPPYALTLVIILRQGALPTFADDALPDIPPQLSAWLRPSGRIRSVSEVAGKLAASGDFTERYWLWQALGEAWAKRCQPREADLQSRTDEERLRIANVILNGEIGYEVLTADDFSMRDYLSSEMLDLDHLSPSFPLLTSSASHMDPDDILSAGAQTRSSDQTQNSRISAARVLTTSTVGLSQSGRFSRFFRRILHWKRGSAD